VRGGQDDQRREATKRVSRAAIFPEVIDKYELLLPIGSGGMATVYLARTRKMGGFEREHALKLLHAHLRDEPSFVQDFLHEARIAARIRHPNVVPVIDVGDSPHGLYLVMDYIEGVSLTGLLRLLGAKGQRLSHRIALRILCDVLGGLHAAHELRDADGGTLGLVHRDFTPQNLIIGTDGLARLTDFGVAKAASGASTAQGLVKGKLSYMSPEQARGLALDRRSDIWAAGVVAWEALTGKKLFSKGEEAATLLKILTSVPASIRTHEPSLPESIANVIARALSREVSARFATAAEMQEAFRAAADEHDLLATPKELGDYVSGFVADLLEERRHDRDHVLKLRAEMDLLLERRLVPTTGSGSGSDPGSASPATPSSSDSWRTPQSAPGDLATTTEPTPAIVRRARAKSFVLGGALLAVVAGSGIVAATSMRRASSTDVPPPPSSITVTAPPSSATAEASAAASIPAPLVSAASTAPATPASTALGSLRVVSDRPIRSVRVKAGDRVIALALDPPTTSTVVAWPDGVQSLEVEAETTQQRRAKLSAHIGDDELRFSFRDEAPAPVRRPAVTPARRLEANPYGKAEGKQP
jgi:serine/threonine-protein kinase